MGLGYQVSNNPVWARSYDVDEWIEVYPPPDGTVLIKLRAEAVFRCVQKLFGAHQYLLNTFPNLVETNYGRHVLGANLKENLPDDAAFARVLYDNFDDLSTAIFGISDALNVLNQIVVVANKRVTPVLEHYPGNPEFQPLSPRQSPPLSPLTITPYEVCEPANKDPFLTTYSLAQATVVMVPEPIREFIVPYENPNPQPRVIEDEFSEQVFEAIDEARDGLLNTRRIAMRARKLFPWYWAWAALDSSGPAT
jgi:hypothetical protein